MKKVLFIAALFIVILSVTGCYPSSYYSVRSSGNHKYSGRTYNYPNRGYNYDAGHGRIHYGGHYRGGVSRHHHHY